MPSTGDSHALTTEQLSELALLMAGTGRLDASTRDRVIVQMCALQPLSLSELAQLLDRRPDYIRKILTALVRGGKLHYQYPDRPQHPHQRYWASPETDPSEPSVNKDAQEKP